MPALAIIIFLLSCCTKPGNVPGLVGAWYGESDWTRWKDSVKLNELRQTFDDKNGHGKSWSAKWEGLIEAPANGKISFILETDQTAQVTIDSVPMIITQDKHNGQAQIEMISGRLYPITVKYSSSEKPQGFFTLKWSWDDKKPAIVSGKYLSHTPQQHSYWAWKDSSRRPEPIIKISSITSPVYAEKGRFAGWPANGGIWSWGNEILVSFNTGYYKKNYSESHSYDQEKSTYKVLARSVDGGQSWTVETPPDLFTDKVEPRALNTPMNFGNPGFALHCDGDYFHFSYDKGKTWQGPFALNQRFKEVTARTDYLVEAKNSALLFLSAKQELSKDDNDDRAYTARTSDGGKTISFVSWMTEEPFTARSVMPATVRAGGNHLVSVLRRRKDAEYENRPGESLNWLDAYESLDDGKTWTFLSKIADTGVPNGNPPSLVLTKDGKLCVVYGVRKAPFGIRARISRDEGKTWGKEVHLRDDALDWDFGYCRSVLRTDGKIVTIYYIATKDNPEQHIDASIWNPDDVQ